PLQPPHIQANYLTNPTDLAAMRNGVKLVRELVHQPAFASLRGEELEPGAQVESDEDIDARLRAMTGSQWHLSCTARMGAADDPDAVVDAQGRVHGISGLRIVDASIMPEVVNANTNAATIMIAEKISDVIIGRPPLRPAGPEAEVSLNPRWATHQR
ncbi:MAG: GMC oxidoreductase, partial [Pseudomonadota bacterium]